MISKKISIILITLIIGLVFVAGGFMFFRKTRTETIILPNNQEENKIKEEKQIAENSVKETKEEIIKEAKEESEIPKKESANEITKKPEIQEENKSDLKINDKLISWGYASSDSRKIDTIIIHSSYDALGDDPFSVNGIIAEYKQYGVSAHYLIGRDGKIYRLVKDKDIAYHAGVSKMPDGRTGVNNFSIGVEIVNTKTGKITAEQYSSLKKLIAEIKGKYSIKYVLGHKDIAPDRKDDPWGFDWNNIK